MSVAVVNMSPTESAIVEVFGVLIGAIVESDEQRERIAENLGSLRDRYVEEGGAAADAGIVIIDKLARFNPPLVPAADK
ncbi:hypothetical protein PMNALOAF_2782 [Methylobacterium adhaesivum]|uniref:Uncharacterized protein n=1 Tax=Methylobacterium adhaesivum TaxID=333297 RepID=A0ABT8BLR7_9HYPH|nr:hypothetical protein [Methylobacterium adhaesivum]MDN3592136.1 hypothetical protein [Methylobacterium adhaesivum]GJD31523.1 hypothetical protein PMNALOAF_2782 [Methylobacterium adhaesivum]